MSTTTKSQVNRNTTTDKEAFPASAKLPTLSPDELYTAIRSQSGSAEQALGVFMEKLLSSIPDLTHKCTLRDKGMQLNYMLECFPAMPAETQLQAALAVTTDAKESDRVPRILKSVIPKMVRHLSAQDKIKLIDSLLENEAPGNSSDRTGMLITTILYGTKSFNELKKVTKGVKGGLDTLTELESKELYRFVALVTLGTKFRQGIPVKAPSQYAQRKHIHQKMRDLKEFLEKKQETLKKYPDLVKTSVGRTYTRILKENLQSLGDIYRSRKSIKEKREFTTAFIKKLPLEFKYNLLLSSERNEKGKAVRHWNTAELQELENAFKKLPGVLFLYTPKLTSIVRAVGDPEIMGQRMGEGSIKLNDCAIDEDPNYPEYEDYSSLLLTFAHELGHSAKFGSWSDGRRHKADIRELIYESDPRYDYAHFVHLSNWNIIPKDQYKIESSKDSIRIDGYVYPLGEALEFEGKERTFSYDAIQKTLYYCDSDADFVQSDYARVSPWEDWCESFVEYFFRPRDFIAAAPEKFLYFDQQFARYENKALVQNALEKSLKKKGVEYLSPLKVIKNQQRLIAQEEHGAD